MSTYGYLRVSSKDQNLARQIKALEIYHIPKKNMYMDKQSGKDFDRPAYRQLMKRLKKGDLLIVKSIDRLGRNYDEILNHWRVITKEKEADILIVDMPLLDTRKKGDNLTGTFVADMVLQILAYVAQTERENIKQRQAEGIAAAKARGVKFGRGPIELPKEFEYYKEQWKKGEISIREAAEKMGISHMTFYRRCKEMK